MDGVAKTAQCKALMRRFSRDEAGATALEYVLIGVIVSIALVPAVFAMKESLFNLPLERIANAIANGGE